MRGLFLLFLCSGCTVGPIYESPEMEIPFQWHSELPLTMCTEEPECLLWWEALQDPILNQLIAYAYEQNLDLQIAATRVLQARAEAKAKRGDLYPHIDASANCGRIYFSKDALVNGVLATIAPKKKPCHVRRNVDYYEVGFDAEWEIDLFGRTAHEIAALKAQEEAIREDLCAIWVTLSAEIAKNYIELRGFQTRLEISRNVLNAQEEASKLTQELFERGVVNEIDLNNAKAEWSSFKAEQPLLELNIIRTIHRLSILLGCSPGGLFECLKPRAPIPQVPCEQFIGLPSELLRRRPDIRKAERELAAATERVGSAVAALFPRFSLRGFIGDISTSAGSLFTPSSATWFAGPQLLLPIFNSQLLLQDVEYNQIATQQALYRYQKTVLEALEESENAIASYRYEEERLFAFEEARRSYQTALEFAEQLYQQGVHDYLTVIAAAKNFLAAEAIYTQSQVDLLLDYIALYKSLGGSWEQSF